MAITPNTPNPVREDSYTTELATKLGIDPKYIPKSPVWRNEEEIAAIAEMFSNMAGGSSGGGVYIVNINVDTMTLDKKWSEIKAALDADKIVIVKSVYGDVAYLTYIAYDDDYPLAPYRCSFNSSEPVVCGAATENGYPVYQSA